ncbi:MAG: hypothetical protein ACI8Z0_002566, partial [Lentimonas sp.]
HTDPRVVPFNAHLPAILAWASQARFKKSRSTTN